MILAFGSAESERVAMLAGPSAVAAVGYLVAALVRETGGASLRVALIVAWVAHAIAIAFDTAGAGAAVPGARFGFAPALSATVWLVTAVYLVESRFLPLPGVRRVLAALGAAAVVLAFLFPGDVRAHAGSVWAPVHWVMGIASYGLFGAAVLHAAMLNRTERRMREPTLGTPSGAFPPTTLGLPLLRLERLTFDFVEAGFTVLTGALLLGWWFADPWRWDHKTVFSMLGWAVFAALLGGRHAFGWRGRRATRWLYAGAGLLLLAYVGSRFVLEVLLHRPVA